MTGNDRMGAKIGQNETRPIDPSVYFSQQFILVQFSQPVSGAEWRASNETEDKKREGGEKRVLLPSLPTPPPFFFLPRFVPSPLSEHLEQARFS